MSDQDARKQSLSELHERRRQVIRLHKKAYGVMQIVDLTGLSWPAVRVALDLYEAGGMAALKPKSRGREQGSGRTLTPAQEDHIRKLIIEKRPEQLKMECALWLANSSSANAASSCVCAQWAIISSAGVSRRKSPSPVPMSAARKPSNN